MEDPDFNLRFDTRFTLAEFNARVQRLQDRADQGEAKAAWNLAVLVEPDSELIPPGAEGISWERCLSLFAQAFDLFLAEAEAGNGESMYYISMYYQSGNPPVQYDGEKFAEWTERAFDAGYIWAGNNLYTICCTPLYSRFNPERAKQILSVLKQMDMLVVGESEL